MDGVNSSGGNPQVNFTGTGGVEGSEGTGKTEAFNFADVIIGQSGSNKESSSINLAHPSLTPGKGAAALSGSKLISMLPEGLREPNYLTALLTVMNEYAQSMKQNRELDAQGMQKKITTILDISKAKAELIIDKSKVEAKQLRREAGLCLAKAAIAFGQAAVSFGLSTASSAKSKLNINKKKADLGIDADKKKLAELDSKGDRGKIEISTQKNSKTGQPERGSFKSKADPQERQALKKKIADKEATLEEFKKAEFSQSTTKLNNLLQSYITPISTGLSQSLEAAEKFLQANTKEETARIDAMMAQLDAHKDIMQQLLISDSFREIGQGMSEIWQGMEQAAAQSSNMMQG